jgi:site-specific DNA recombinase
MKNVLIYIRVSTDEQAERGFSLDAQEEALLKYAKLNKLIVLKIFREDYSAKDGFNRPAYRELLEFIKHNKGISEILVTQWSRFSRNGTESFIQLRELGAKGIVVTPIEQLTDDSIPENLILKAIHLFMPQVENERLSLRTKAGMRQALKQGRWLWKAPFGYKNNTITKLIEIDFNQAEIVRFGFDTMSTGLYTSEDVRRMCIEKGLNISKQGFLNLLKNILYTGYLRIEAFKDEPETVILGVHPPIVPTEIFEDVQTVLQGKKKPYKGVTKKEELPLVGYLYCPKCNNVMTGSASKGNGGAYHYYHCQRKYEQCKNSFRASNANSIFENYLQSFQAEPEVLELYHMILEDVFKSNGNDREIEKEKLEKEILAVKGRIQDAAFKNLAGTWDDTIFKQTKGILEEQKSVLESKYTTLKNMKSEFATYLNYSTSLLGDLGGYYKTASAETKKRIIGSIFPEKIYFEQNKYRTTKINEVVSQLFNVGKGFNIKQPRKNSRLSSVAPPAGLEPATL